MIPTQQQAPAPPDSAVRQQDPAGSSGTNLPQRGSTGTGQEPRGRSIGAVLEAPRVPVSDVAPDPNNPAARAEDVSDITSTLDAVGLLHPLAVVDRDRYVARYPEHEYAVRRAKFVVIDGNRRLEAARKHGLDVVPIDLRNDLIEQSRDTKTRIIANLRRRDLAPLDEAREYRRLLDLGDSARSIGAELGCTHSHVVKRVKLLTLAAAIQDELTAGRIAVIDALTLGELAEHEAQETALDMVKRGRKARIAVAEVKAASTEQPKAVSPDEFLAQAIESRDATCVEILRLSEAPESDHMLLLASFVVRTSSGAAPALAHTWMRAAGIGPDLHDLKAFANAVGQAEGDLIRYAVAIGLAADELHARDPRRATWDIRSVRHHRRLVGGGHIPTEWDIAHLPDNV